MQSLRIINFILSLQRTAKKRHERESTSDSSSDTSDDTTIEDQKNLIIKLLLEKPKCKCEKLSHGTTGCIVNAESKNDLKPADVQAEPEVKRQRLTEPDPKEGTSKRMSDRIGVNRGWRRTREEIEEMRVNFDLYHGGSSFRYSLASVSRINTKHFCYFYNENDCRINHSSHNFKNREVSHFCSDCTLVIPGWVNFHAAGSHDCPILIAGKNSRE